MSETSLAPEAFKHEIERLLAEKRRQDLSKFNQNALAWLALVPAWTEQLACECDFPGKERLHDFVHEAQAAGLCLLKQSANPDRSTWYITYVYSMLAPYIPVSRQYDALTFVQQIEQPRLQSQSLAKLALHLRDEFVPTMLVTAQTIEDPYARATPLLALKSRLLEEQQPALLNGLRDAVPLVTDTEEQVELLLALISHTAEDQRSSLIQQVFSSLTEAVQESRQASVLIRVLPFLPVQFFPFILERAEALTKNEPRVQLYIALARHTSPDMRASILQKAYEVLGSDLDMEKKIKAYLLSKLALEVAHSGEFDFALTVARKIIDEETRVHTFIEIVQAIGQSGNLERAKEQAQHLLEANIGQDDAIWNINLFVRIARTLNQMGEKDEAAHIIRYALDTATPLIPSVQNVYVLSSLAEVLIQLKDDIDAIQMLEKALEAAESISNTHDRCKALLNIASFASYFMCKTIIYKILDNIRIIDDVGIRIQELVNLAPYLKENKLLTVLDEALRLAKAMQEEFSFWMPDTVRSEVLTSFAQMNPDFLLAKLQEIGPSILQARGNGLPISAAVVRWAELASRAQDGTERVARWLDRQIEQLVEGGDTGQALAWVNTATILLPVLQGELEMSIILGNRRVELSYRQSQDARHLQYFLKRQEQIDDFMSLLQQTEASSHSPWALHYIGLGGVGKTTLIRYIAAYIAPRFGIPTSRIDFDYLNPDYPSHRPGQLLIELAKELQAYGTGKKPDTLFQAFQQRVVHFHEALSSTSIAADPLASIRLPEFHRVMQAFCDFLGALPQPVVLILDTCEELAKFQPLGAAPPNLKATFDILQRIHDVVPSVRVVFAGRRFLTQGGTGWFLDEQCIQEGQSLLQEKKDYLRLHEIRGFTEEEALRFLKDTKQFDIPSELQQAILKRSLDTGSSPCINWQPSHPFEHDRRYNPFDLALYADWVREDSKVTPEIIGQGKTDPYVEMRILNRIHQNDVSRLLPAALLLRRFDKVMLRPAFDGSDAAFTEVYQELGNLEWIEYQPEETTTFLEIDRNFYPRLLAYYRHPDRHSLLEAARLQLSAGLLKRVENLSLNQLQIDHIEAAIRLLPEEQAATLWNSLAQSITANAAWGRAGVITAHLLDSAVSEQHSARAALRATFISVMLHEQPECSVVSFWDEVAQTAHADPDPIVCEWLLRRAFVGRIAAMGCTQDLSHNVQLTDFWYLVAQFPHPISDGMDTDTYRREQWAGSLCAAIEALLELAEQKGMRHLVSSPQQVARWVTALEKCGISSEVQAFASMLAGRAMALYEHWEEARELFEKACNALPQDIAQSRHQRWADWRVPDSLHDRVRLEALRTVPRHLLTIPADTWLRWQQEARERLPLIDADRLISYTLTLRLAYEVVPQATLDELATNDTYVPERQPECEAHRVRPLFAIRALALQALGEGADALRLVDERIQDVTKAAVDRENTVRAAENTKAQIIRRMRATHTLPVFIERYAHSNNLEDRTVIWPAIVLGNATNDDLIPPSINTDNLFFIHCWWRNCKAATINPGIDKLRDLSRASLPAGLSSSASFEEISLVMDIQEARLLLQKTCEDSTFFDMKAWCMAHPTQTEQALRLWLRAMALGRALSGSPQEEIHLSRSFGARWIAELALDEGELLALRLPRQAKLLFDMAYRMFDRAKDRIGAFIATTSYVIAAIHAGVTGDECQELKSKLKTAYERLPELNTLEWPSWNELLSMQPSSNEQIRSIWQGWLERVLSCALWLDTMENENAEPFIKLERDWLIPQYGKSLPDELNLPKVGSAIQIEEAGEDIQSQSVAGIGKLLIIAGVVLAMTLILSGLFILSLSASLDNACFVVCGLASSYLVWLIPIPPVLTGAYILIGQLRRSIRAKLAAQTILALSINRDEGLSWQKLPEDRSWTMSVNMRQRRRILRFGWPPTYLQPEKSIDGTSYISGVQEYRSVIKMLPVTVVKELVALKKRLSNQKLQIPLDIFPGLQAIPWEALFTLALPTASQTLWGETFQFWRRGNPQPAYQKAPSALEESERVVGVLSSLAWRPTVTRGWKALEYSIQVYGNLKGLDRFKNGIKILHIICTPTPSTSGWLLQIKASNQSNTSSEKTTAEQVIRGDEVGGLIRVEDLPLTSASLVVIQAEPMEMVHRLDTEREQTADLRSCAATIFSAGAKTVIMLPALPLQLTELVLEQLATCYENQDSPDLQRILDTISDIRSIIARWDALEDEPVPIMQEQIVSETQLELALDVSVFTRASVS